MMNEKYDETRASHIAGMILTIKDGILEERKIQGIFNVAMDYKAMLVQRSEETTAALKNYLEKLPEKNRITFEQNNGLYNGEPKRLSNEEGDLNLETMRCMADMEIQEGLLRRLISS